MEISSYVDRPFFQFKYPSAIGTILNLLRGESVLEKEALKEAIRFHTGDITFKEIHDLYKWNLNITVTDSIKTDEAKLLNYLTAPNVVVWTAALASCAIPMFFDPGELLIKDEEGNIVPYHERTRLYIDGSIGGDLPMQRMSELFNVNTFIVSQVNPHVVPFVAHDGGGILESQMKKRFKYTIKAFIGNEIKHWIIQLCTLGLLPASIRRLSHLVTQSYKGHITIVPQPDYRQYGKILKNPTYKDFADAI